MKDQHSRDRDREILAEKEVQKIVSGFIASRHRGTRLVFHEIRLTAKEQVPIYHLEGSFQPHSRSMVDRFVYSPTAPYTFIVKVDALQGRVLSYELR